MHQHNGLTPNLTNHLHGKPRSRCGWGQAAALDGIRPVSANGGLDSKTQSLFPRQLEKRRNSHRVLRAHTILSHERAQALTTKHCASPTPNGFAPPLVRRRFHMTDPAASGRVTWEMDGLARSRKGTKRRLSHRVSLLPMPSDRCRSREPRQSGTV